MDSTASKKTPRKFKPTRRGDLVTRLVNGEEIWYFDDYVKDDRFDAPKRVRKSTGCAKADYEHAKEVRDKIRAEIKSGNADMKRPMTFREWIPVFRETFEREPRFGKEIAPATIKGHNACLPALLDFFGNMRVERIGETECLAYYAKRLKDPVLLPNGKPMVGRIRSKNTVIRECNFARSIMADAVRGGKALKNPWTGLFKQLGQIGSRDRILSTEELSLLFQSGRPELLRFVKITIGTSLRIGGMLTLPIDCVQEGGMFGVVSVMSKGKVHRQPLLPWVRQAIDQQAAEIRVKRPGTTRLFPYKRDAVMYWIEAACKATGIAKFTPHDIRRTFGTRAGLVLGPEVASALMNNTPDVFKRHYFKPENSEIDATRFAALEKVSAKLLPASVTSTVTPEIEVLQVADE